MNERPIRRANSPVISGILNNMINARLVKTAIPILTVRDCVEN